MSEHTDPVAFVRIEDGVTKPYAVVTVFEHSGTIARSFEDFESAYKYGGSVARFWMVELKIACKVPWEHIKEVKDEGENES